ncbi:MAG: aldo/keto reductase [Planctomycetota bacterium]
MDYRYLGRTGIRVSPLCLGTMTFGGTTEPAQADQILRHAIDHGINFLDTANVYNQGRSETILGQAVADLGPAYRDRLVLATKCHGNMFKPEHVEDPKLAQLDPNRWGNSRRQVIEQCHASLKRLGTDYIDLYQIHRPHPACPNDETLRALDDLVTTGKVRYLGCSTFAGWQLVESLWVAEKLGLNRFVTEQPPYNLLDRRIERELAPACQNFGLAIIPWSPLAGGFLTGKYKRAMNAPSGARYSGGGGKGRADALLNNDRAFNILETVTQLAKAKSCTPGQLALNWCMNQPGITAPIIGPRTLDQLKDNLPCLDLTLTPQDHDQLNAASPPGTHAVDYYKGSWEAYEYR